MGVEERFVLSFSEKSEILGELVGGQSIIEIAGDNRVLIEKHFGVEGYSREKITVKVKFGSVIVNGRGLELARMNKANLVILGKIECVSLCRRQ